MDPCEPVLMMDTVASLVISARAAVRVPDAGSPPFSRVVQEGAWVLRLCQLRADTVKFKGCVVLWGRMVVIRLSGARAAWGKRPLTGAQIAAHRPVAAQRNMRLGAEVKAQRSRA
ncbi:hypothetical protein GCM10009837_66680 [Streptomyces durmitorensis]